MGDGEIEFEFKNSKIGQEFRLKGHPALVDKYIEKYGLESIMKDAKVNQVVPGQESPNQSQDVTVDTLERPEATSLTEYITKVINSEWARQGRTSAEIIEMAKAHGISSLKHSTLSGILFGLLQTNKVRRVKRPEDKRWLYSPSSEYALSKHQ